MRSAPSGRSSRPCRPADARDRGAPLIWLFGATLFLSATLLFSVQLIFTRMVLPLLGGSAAVWTTCMLFFQAVLLGGYAYAHGLASRIPDRAQRPIHLAVLAVSLLALPIGLAPGWSPPADGAPVPWLLGLLAVSLGLPFFLLSTTAPLLQQWYARLGPATTSPYVLYAASNLGSMVGLLSYPVLVEPRWTLVRQRELWSHGYLLLGLAIGCCALVTWRRGAARAADRQTDGSPVVSWRERIRWTVLALVPSSLLLGVTTYISTDIAAVPFLWVVPLALYLLTFVMVFAARPPVPHRVVVGIQPVAVLPLVFIWFWGIGAAAPLLLALHLVAFFVTILVCHGELAARRPPAGRLTEFYLWLSVGGAAGAVFNAVAAPHVFTTVVEYPLALLTACALRPGRPAPTGALARWGVPLRAVAPAAIMVLLASGASGSFGDTRLPPFAQIVAVAVASACVAALCFSLKERPVAFAVSLAAVLFAGGKISVSRSPILHAERNFFGVHRVKSARDGLIHTLFNGTTLHGAEFTTDERVCEPLTYYSREGPLGQVFDVLAPAGRRVGVVGLGTGSILVYARPDERWTFYEIDPAVERIARDPSYFRYIERCSPTANVVLGDARLSLARAEDASFGMIVLDAFSSDAIPVHLLTREALALYQRKLAPGGVLALHLSNRHLRLTKVVTALARDAGLAGRIEFGVVTAEQRRDYKLASLWAVLARREADLGPLATDARWRRFPDGPAARVWTDDYSDVWSVLIK